MAVKMLNPKPDEYVIDPAAGSGGFLISAMYHVRDKYCNGKDESMQEYAREHIWGIDFADEISKVSRALMLMFPLDGVNLEALLRRLMITWPTRVLSTITSERSADICTFRT